MAKLDLVRLIDSGSDVDTLSLYQYADDIGVANWIPGGEIGDEPVQESLTLNIKNDRSAALRALDDKIAQVKDYNDAQEERSVWLRNNTGSTSFDRQSLILEMSGGPALGWHDYASTHNEYLTYALTMTRMPFWESSMIGSFTTENVSGNGVKATLTSSDIPGVESARIINMGIHVTSSMRLTKEVWMGFRSNRFGDSAYFYPNWDCGLGFIQDTDDTTDGGTTMVTDFTDTTEEDRFTVRICDVSIYPSMYDCHRGEFQVLLRAQVDGGAAHVRLKDGIYPISGAEQSQLTDTATAHSLVQVDSTSAMIYNLGTVSIPGGRGINTSLFFANFGLRLSAKSTTGTNTLTCHKFILVPRSEGYLYIDNAALDYALGDDYAAIRTYPEGTVDGWFIDSGVPTYRLTLDPHNFYLPQGPTKVILVGQSHLIHYTDSLYTLVIDYIPRWRTMSSYE